MTKKTPKPSAKTLKKLQDYVIVLQEQVVTATKEGLRYRDMFNEMRDIRVNNERELREQIDYVRSLRVQVAALKETNAKQKERIIELSGLFVYYKDKAGA